MPVTAEWADIQHTIILQRYTGRWNWSEFYASFRNEINPMMSSQAHTVHLLADVSASASIPQGNLSHTRNVLYRLPANHGLAIVFNGNSFINLLVQIFKRINPGGVGDMMETAATLDEVYALIERHRVKN